MPHRVGGLTGADNGQGLCERSNQVKELPGWQVVVLPGDHHRTLITTPTGHAYERIHHRLSDRALDSTSVSVCIDLHSSE
ncbi:MAG: hypothetical protein WKF82_06575 [Nocardioidaceae bacterium]